MGGATYLGLKQGGGLTFELSVLPPTNLSSCFTVCNTAKLGIGSGDKAMNLAILCVFFFSDNFFLFFFSA